MNHFITSKDLLDILVCITKTSTEAVRKYRAKNREKVREYTRIQAKEWFRNNPESQRKWKENNPEKVKKIARDYNFKIKGWSTEEFEKVFLDQNGLCWICSVELVRTPGAKNSAHADHNHTTNKRRGILCAKCNFVEGHLSKAAVSPTEFISKLLEYYKVFDKEDDNVSSMA